MQEHSFKYSSANTIGLLLVLFVNGLANGLPLNGVTTGEVSDRFQVYFVPAGYVFSIWGLIYAFLIGFVVYQWLPAQRDNPAVARIGWLFLVNCLANAAWIFLWHYGYFVLTVIVMLVLLATLIGIYLRLDIGRSPVSGSDRLFFHVPFSLYLGWISVATIANTASLLDYLQWSGWGLSPVTWTQVMLAVVVALAALMAWRRRDIVYLLVIVWALIGIAIKQAAEPAVANAAWIATAVVVLLLAWTLLRRPAPSPQ